MIRALLWDVDGTLAETERDGHRVAFNRAFETAGVPWRWSAAHYGRLLEIAGGYERLLHDLRHRDEAPAASAAREGLARQLHQLKNGFYEDIVRAGELPLRAGVAELLAECAAAGVPMAIATTTSSGNVAALLEHHLGRDWRGGFAAVVTAAEAPRKKPDPQVYQQALMLLGLAPEETVAIEDAPAGVLACRRARVPVIVAHSHYFPTLAAEALVRAAGPSLGSGAGWRPSAESSAAPIGLEQLRRWSGG